MSEATHMHLNRALLRIAPWIFCALAGMAASASAQTNVRVTRDQTTIWTADFTETAAVVRAGTILTVVRRHGDWYEVRVPTAIGGSGWVLKSNVDTNTSAPRPVARTTGVVSPPRTLGIVGVGQFGYVRFAAQQSFNAILGAPGGGFYGGGAEVRVTNAFLSASVERFEKTGQRVLVMDGEVFALGIPDTITVMPIAVTAGWRVAREGATPYVGGGVGRMLYKEQTRLPGTASSGCTCRTASPGEVVESVDTHFASYHMLTGVEFRNEWAATAFEVQYTVAPNTIGVGGASAAFHETNLGGFTGRIKILFGR
jgi:opacity protein-like surface antigen